MLTNVLKFRSNLVAILVVAIVVVFSMGNFEKSVVDTLSHIARNLVEMVQ